MRGGGGKTTPAITSTTSVRLLMGTADAEMTPQRTQAAAAVIKH